MREDTGPVQHQPRARIGFGPASAILVVLLSYLGSQIFAGVFIGLFAEQFGYSANEINDLITNSTTWQFGFMLAVYALSLLIIFGFMKRRQITRKMIGLGRKPRGGDIGPAFVSFGIYFVLLIAATALMTKLFPGINVDQKQQIGFDNTTGSSNLFLVFFSLAIIPPIAEEIMVRGFLYSGLRTKLGKVVAALIASVIFGIAHLQLGSGAPPLWTAALDTFVLSMVLIHLREKTGALWAGMLVHGIKNTLAFFALFVFHQ